MSDLYTIATHEAGHVVAHLALGHTVVSVSITETHGFTEVQTFNISTADKDALYKHMIAALAGPQAVWYCSHGNPRDGSRADYDDARKLAIRMIGVDGTAASQLISRAKAHAQELVIYYSDAIRLMADVLLQCPVLSTKRVERLFRAKNPERLAVEPWPVQAYP